MEFQHPVMSDAPQLLINKITAYFSLHWLLLWGLIIYTHTQARAAVGVKLALWQIFKIVGKQNLYYDKVKAKYRHYVVCESNQNDWPYLTHSPSEGINVRAETGNSSLAIATVLAPDHSRWKQTAAQLQRQNICL